MSNLCPLHSLTSQFAHVEIIVPACALTTRQRRTEYTHLEVRNKERDRQERPDDPVRLLVYLAYEQPLFLHAPHPVGNERRATSPITEWVRILCVTNAEWGEDILTKATFAVFEESGSSVSYNFCFRSNHGTRLFADRNPSYQQCCRLQIKFLYEMKIPLLVFSGSMETISDNATLT
jgi:hypothetical protein